MQKSNQINKTIPTYPPAIRYTSINSKTERGLQPKVPSKYCGFQNDLSPLKAEKLEIVWGKEGFMASLYEGDELICVIPNWAGQDFSGYSKYSCTDKFSTIPFPLGSSNSNALSRRIEEARGFRSSMYFLIPANPPLHNQGLWQS